MEKKTQFSIWYFFLAIFLILIIQKQFSSPHVESIPYSQFRQFVQENKVYDLVLAEKNIRGVVEESVQDTTKLPQGVF